MLISRLTLCNLRSRPSLVVELGPRLNILAGPNGAGKTTVLEAAMLTLDGEQLRAGSLRDLIGYGKDHLRVEVELTAEDAGDPLIAAVAYSRDGDHRLSAGGLPLADCSRWREAIPVRTFVPDDLRLIKGSPRRRRAYLDTLASRRDPGYATTLKQYDSALAQRNMLLRTTRGSGDAAQFSVWERLLAETGLTVCERRAATLGGFISAFQEMHRDLTAEPVDAFRLTYRTNAAGLDSESYQARLAEMRGADRQRTFTHLGPHRDDFRLMRAGLDMRDCASQGEQRAALLTLVLAEWEYLLKTGPTPLLLLDDVMSELDEARRRALLRIVRRGGQVVITTTDLRYFSQEELDEATVVELEQEAQSLMVMATPEDFDRVGDLLGDFCEAAASSDPASPTATPDDEGQRGPGRGSGRAPGGKTPGDIARALAATWPEIAGAEVAANATPVQLKSAKLVVSASSSVWAHTLQYMGEDLMVRLNERLGPGTVKQISFRHAGWEERPPGGTADCTAREEPPPAQLSREQEEAFGQLEGLDLPPEIRERIARAMRASFARGHDGSVR